MEVEKPITIARTRIRYRLPYISLNRFAQYAVLLGVLALALVVVLTMISMSLRPRIALLLDFWALPIPPFWGNYRWALRYLQEPLVLTLFIVGTSIVGILIFACPAAYALARIHFPGRRFIFLAVLALIMIPGPIMLTPNFILANQWGLKGTVPGLILFYMGGGQAFAIFLITVFLRNQEQEMFEAARIDGATELRALWHIALPLARPIIMTVALMSFLTLYSDLIWPLLMLPNDQRTVMIALSKINPMDGAASFVIASLPQLLLFMGAMKYFVQGLSSGAVKG